MLRRRGPRSGAGAGGAADPGDRHAAARRVHGAPPARRRRSRPRPRLVRSARGAYGGRRGMHRRGERSGGGGGVTRCLPGAVGGHGGAGGGGALQVRGPEQRDQGVARRAALGGARPLPLSARPRGRHVREEARAPCARPSVWSGREGAGAEGGGLGGAGAEGGGGGGGEGDWEEEEEAEEEEEE